MYPSAKFSARPPSPQFVNFSPPSDYPSAVASSSTSSAPHHHSMSMRHPKSSSKSMMMGSDGDSISSGGGRMISSNTISGRGDLIFPDDIESIEFCIPPSNDMMRAATNACHGDSFSERRRRGHSRRSNQKIDTEKQVKWSRKNLAAATMDRFETNQPLEYGFAAGVVAPNIPPMAMTPSTSAMTPLHQSMPGTPQQQQQQQQAPINHVYSYAYYEPGAAKCHTNIPHKDRLSPILPIPGPSKSPPRNSIRALLAKSFRSKTFNAANSSEERHTYTTRYGTTENLYEEVNEQKIRKVLSDNRIGSANTGAVKEELRRVQHNHFRVLDELNLSLEALIMPPTPPDISPTQESSSEKQQQPPVMSHTSLENLSSTLNSIELKDHTCINPEFDEGDLDSGFSGSGSSSGASYNESLRYYKTGTQSVMHTTTLPHNLRSCRSSTASGTSTSKSSMNSSEDQGIGMLTTTNTSSSPFNYNNRRCSDTQRSSARSASASATGTKPKKNFWTIKP
ncbi:uncharacterized protein LOC129909920 isoform X1 [Episyrphus balteatus]|uniref:uncharacterized protein LOC129909920 isoform X1 n=1 Tax=Episyrphus balteatus TaxID=286459 RepID=UPI002485DA20|nr:uncharacterized protein LOC129909920 isoform X1 [Episyrphus balteatus]